MPPPEEQGDDDVAMLVNYDTPTSSVSTMVDWYRSNTVKTIIESLDLLPSSPLNASTSQKMRPLWEMIETFKNVIDENERALEDEQVSRQSVGDLLSLEMINRMKAECKIRDQAARLKDLEDQLRSERHHRDKTESAQQVNRANRESPDVLLLDDQHRRDTAWSAQNQHAFLQDLQDSLSDEKCHRKAAEKEAQTERRHREMIELSLREEQNRRERAENKLKEKAVQIQEIQKRWKQAARELNELRSQEQSFHIMTDDYLIERVNGLRYSIKNFAINYYGGSPRAVQNFTTKPWLAHIIKSDANLKTDLMSQDNRANAIQAFLWRVLVNSVFDKFWRVTGAAQTSTQQLVRVLRPKSQGAEGYAERPDVNAERKFQLWKASTAALLIEAVENRPGTSESTAITGGGENANVISWTWDLLQSLPTSGGPRGMRDELHQIFREATALDKEITRQVARIEWYFPISGGGMKFNPQCMTVARDQAGPATTDIVRLVLAPRVTKQGKSTGTDFEEENQLLPMEVSLERAPESRTPARVARSFSFRK